MDKIELVSYLAEVQLSVNEGVKLPADTIASIRTEGLLGASYVSLSPGSASTNLQPGGRISQTEPALDLVDLLIKYGLKPKGEGSAGEPEL